MKMVKKLHSANVGQVNGSANREAALVGSSPEYAMNFDLKDMADLTIAEFSLPEKSRLPNGRTYHGRFEVDTNPYITGASSGFQTDADISGNQLRGERELKRWVPEGQDNADFSLESSNSGTWDQFATNSHLFGAKSTYDENLYTTAIDRSAPSYRRREAEAERIAREIEGSTSSNAHMREERGQALENDGEDEEEKYSGVRRDEKLYPPLAMGGANKYMPPARRAPTGQATVPGVPVDPAIISAQISQPEPRKSPAERSKQDRGGSAMDRKNAASVDGQSSSEANNPAQPQSSGGDKAEQAPRPAASSKDGSSDVDEQASNKALSQGPTENVEAKVLHQFRQFADIEKQRVIERRKAQANQDRAAKLNELLRFSKTFKLKTPIPNDLIGILAKDPAKQEAIVERAHKESHESASKPSPTQAPLNSNANRKVDIPQAQPSVPDRQMFNRGRGGYAQAGRSDRPAGQQQASFFQGRNNSVQYQARFGGHQQDRKNIQPPSIPAPIPIIEGRVPPTGPMADQSAMTSPQRSNMHTPNSAISGKFNLNVKASEFRPTAATFNPAASSQAPSSPGSTQRAGSVSVSRTASPSMFFGKRKAKPASQRPSISKYFNPILRMKAEHAPKKPTDATKPEEVQKDYSNNGGIPHAFQTGPRWTVKPENDHRTYEEAFDQPVAPPVISPSQSRSTSSQHIPYAGQGMVIPSGPANLPYISNPPHVPHAGSHHYPHQYDDGSQRMQYGGGNPSVFPSPSLASRQASAYASPMAHAAQLSYGQQAYFGTPNSQMSVPMRPYPNTPGMMHAQVGQMSAPMMVQQPSNGPYMAVQQQFNHQTIYSPNPSHVYPQVHGGYSSPGRIAPMMMQQGSQQGHLHAPNMMYSMSNHGAPPLVYQQQQPQQPQMGVHRGGYGGHQYGSTPHQGYAMQHRTMSSGYGQIPHKMHPQMQQAHGPPQGLAHGQIEGVQDDGK